MKTEFPGFFSSTVVDIEKMWDECIFVLDANVLLNLYRYSDLTCEKLLEVFEGLGDRLWIPHQVALEYFNNRLAVIGEQGKIYDDAIKKVEALKKSLESFNQHPFVSEGTLNESLVVFGRLIAELGDNKSVHEKRISSDEIKDKLGGVLDGKVGQPFERERMEKVLTDGQLRYEQKIPPGFCDAKKYTDSVVFTEKCRPYGDYIVWLQILDKAKADQKPVVFVTGDAKEDWWSSFQGKTLGPQPQLIEEFLSVVGSNFYMYPPDRFLERASEYLNQVASEEAVEEIRNIRVDDTENMLLDIALNSNWPADAKANDRSAIAKILNRWGAVGNGQKWSSRTDLVRLKFQEARLRQSLNDARSELKALNDFHHGLNLSSVSSEDPSVLSLIEKMRDMSFLVGQLTDELESVHREIRLIEKTITPDQELSE